MKYIAALLFPATLALLLAAPVHALPAQFPELNGFIDEMVDKHQFQRDALHALFAQARHQPEIIELMTRPAERRPWHDYRPIFLTEQRIRGGVEFIQEHQDLLARAEQEYGVPPHVITAIIGVETFYGRHKGRHRVIDALTTLGFDYPPRATFFRGQLEQFLLMSREEQRDPLAFVGSYAGAMGMPQFIPSSFRAYAVDFDGDGRRDLWDNHADIIGSVANYFAEHRWQPGQPVVARATLSGAEPQALIAKGVRPSIAQSELKAHGINTQVDLPADAQLALIALDRSPEEKEYWLAMHNFYVITRYNRSQLYAMAVHQLSEAIRSAHATQQRRSAAGNS
ncbi:MAG: lytic murein transglycosylase B [Chromatiales bacterium]|nr:lytic murein transglycosylase B [Gammaproteobacteria bacterium]MBW6476560.1 lytic murein transglycosylase B [Chromatiales bacterium]